MKVKDILDRVTTLYNDTDYIRVPESTYFKFIYDALNQLVLLRPDCHVKTDIIKLNTGTRQRLPSNGCALIDIYMNKKAVITDEGDTVFHDSYPITRVDRIELDYSSAWHTWFKSDKKYVTEFAYDTKSPDTFWVTPPVEDSSVYVEVDYSYPFYDILSIDDVQEIRDYEIDLPDIWMGPICNYVLHLLYSVDSTSQLDRQIAQSYLQSFYQSINLEYESSNRVSPTVDNKNKPITGVIQNA